MWDGKESTSPAVNTYNSDGTLATTRDFNGNRTTFASYDANGLPTNVVDAAEQPGCAHAPNPVRLRLRQVAPHYGVQDTGLGDTTSATYT